MQTEFLTFKWGLRFMHRFIPAIIGLMLISVCMKYIDTLEPLFTGRIIDVLTAKDGKRFFYILIWLTCLQFGGVVFSLVLMWCRMKLQRKITLVGEGALFSTIVQDGIRQGTAWKGNATNAFVSDLSTMVSIYYGQIPDVIISLFTLCVVGYRLYSIHRILFWLSLFFSFMPIFLSHVFGMRQALIQSEARKTQDRYVEYLEETFAGIREINTKDSKKFFIARFGKILDRVFFLVRRMTKLSMQSSLCFFMTNYIIGMVLFIIVGLSVIQGRNSIGQLVSALLYSQQLRSISSGFGSAYQNLLTSQVSTARIMELFEKKHQEKVCVYVRDTQHGIPSVVFDDFTFCYVDRPPVFSGLNLSIEGNGLHIIKGANGAGKTTLLQCILGEVPVDSESSGKIVFRNLAEDDVSMVFQSPFIFSLSVRDNLAMGKMVQDSMIWDALKLVKLDSLVRQFTKGLGTILLDSIKLSQGQYQRLALARCIVQSTPIMLLDEIETSLDAESSAVIRETLLTLADTTMLILVTHSKRYDEIASSITVLP